MARQEILDQFEQNFGLVPDFSREMPDPILEQYSSTREWVTSDTTLTARDKAWSRSGRPRPSIALTESLTLGAVRAERDG